MPKLVFISPDGSKTEIDAEVGETIMRNAVNNDVDGIEAMCGGSCSCATCHVFVAREWMDRVGKPDETEEAMLFFATGAKENSRLSCQIEMSADLDGLILHMPEHQG